MPNNVKITSSHRVLMIALLAAAFACYLLVEPYINSIVMAFIISLLMFPVHEWFERKMPKHKNSASLLTCVVLTFIIVIPLLFVFAAIVQQGSVFLRIRTNGSPMVAFKTSSNILGLSKVYPLLMSTYLSIKSSQKPSPKKSGNLLPLLVQTLSRSVRRFWVMQQTS